TAEFGMASDRATALWPPENCLGQLSLVSGSCDRATVMTQVKDQPPVRVEFRGFATDNGPRTTDKEQCSLKTTHRSGKFVRELNRLFSLEKKKTSDQAARPISTGRLKALRLVHVQPINPVVFRGSLGSLRSGRPYLGRSLALRCFQRLSLPHMATQRCL